MKSIQPIVNKKMLQSLDKSITLWILRCNNFASHEKCLHIIVLWKKDSHCNSEGGGPTTWFTVQWRKVEW